MGSIPGRQVQRIYVSVKTHTRKKHSELICSVIFLLLLIQVDTARLGAYYYNLSRT
jgi:hypothetical protein